MEATPKNYSGALPISGKDAVTDIVESSSETLAGDAEKPARGNDSVCLHDFNASSELIAVVGSAEKAPGGRHTVYVIDCELEEDSVGTASSNRNARAIKSWQVRRRYREFFSFNERLRSLSFVKPELPPKRLWNNLKEQFIA